MQPAHAQDNSWQAALGNPREILAELREEVVQIPLLDATVQEKAFPLTGTLYQPSGAGPFPLVILNHGSPAAARNRDSMGRYRLIPQTRELMRRGFAVLVPMRRGYGASPGDYAEKGGCAPGAFAEAGRQSARDVLSAVAYARTRPTLDTQRMVLMGQSAGGFASLAAAGQAPPGLLAVLNFSGGRGGTGLGGAHCDVEGMARTVAGYAATTRAPVLWFYVENDKYFSPEAARAWFAAFEAAGGKGRLVMNPPHGNDGHLLFYAPEAVPIWSGAIDSFFRERGLNGFSLSKQ
ncbi:MAG: prolyl oligopeptidase family serine peptidase [Burkholderiales bacterium]|nr:prolyl oligopeptidase family serine peptidase [Burkholderiales bacterium]